MASAFYGTMVLIEIDADEEEDDDANMQYSAARDGEGFPPPFQQRKVNFLHLSCHCLSSEFSLNPPKAVATHESSKKERVTGSQVETKTPRPAKRQKAPQSVDPNFNRDEWVEARGNESVSQPHGPCQHLHPLASAAAAKR